VSDLHYRSLSDTCRRVKSGELSATQVVSALLARIERVEPELGAFTRVMAEEALTQAQRLDAARAAGEPLGALHGVPVAVKDLFHTRGVVTASGTRVMADFVPDEDATVVALLKRAGAVIIGKTKLWEGAFGVHHPDVTAPRNPWSPAHWTGGSSTGSGVAVAAGMAFGALGSDTGGSIRFPCATCAVVGIKPTYGRVSRHGAFPLAESLDHVGPMTRCVEDAARMLQVLAGHDRRDPTSLEAAVPNYAQAWNPSLGDLTIGVDWDYVSRGVEDEVVATVGDAISVFRSLGARILEVMVPASARALVRGWSLTAGVECARAHAAYYPARKAEYGPVLSSLIELGRHATRADYENLEQLRGGFRREFDTLLEGIDMLVAPCMPTLPPPLGADDGIGVSEDQVADFLTFTAPFNYSGHPALVLPAGLTPTGLPRAFQLIGRRLDEPTLFRAGMSYEQALGWSGHPAV
jgi:amidase